MSKTTERMDAGLELIAKPGTVHAWHNQLVDPDRNTPITADGPWQHEPSKIQFVDASTGLPCLIVRGPMGQLCGYVGVNPGHKLHGVFYDDVSPYPDVHGGLTYADVRRPHGEDHSRGVCHIPEPGTPDHVWWFGFDCAHLGDVVPGMVEFRGSHELERGTYKDVAYVVAEVHSLAVQLAAAA